MRLHQCAAPALLAITFASPIHAEALYTSQVTGLAITAADILPPAPAQVGDREVCNHLFLAAPETAAGRAALAKGWGVTAEAPFSTFTAVSFVGSAVAATSGTCELRDGNVGLFLGDRLVALLYSTEGDDPMIGHVTPFGDGGLRVFSGDTLPSPVADLQHSDSDGITVTRLASDELACNGAASVPNIYDLPIDEARARLIRAGWKPVPGDPEQQAFSQAAGIAALGVPEVEDCSGTGFAFCAYRYTGPVAELSVTTAGEGDESGSLPWVTSYGVDCH